MLYGIVHYDTCIYFIYAGEEYVFAMAGSSVQHMFIRSILLIVLKFSLVLLIYFIYLYSNTKREVLKWPVLIVDLSVSYVGRYINTFYFVSFIISALV